MKFITKIAFLVFVISVSVQGYKIPELAREPVIDGEIGKSEWAGAISFVKKPVARRFTVYIGWFGDRFYLACDCRDSQADRIKSVVSERDGLGIWSDDCVEIFIDTNRDKSTYYHFIVNAGGAIYDEFVRDRGWDCESVRYAVKRDKRGWRCEMSVGVGAFDMSDVYGRWGINVMRHFQGGYQVLGGRAHNPQSWGEFSIPEEVANRILKPTINRKFEANRKAFAGLEKRAKQSVFYADICPFIASARVKIEQIESMIGSENSQQVVDLLDELHKDVRRLGLIVNRAEGFERIARKQGMKSRSMIAFVLSPMIKVRKDFLLPKKLNDEIKMSAARGESESIQVMLASWNRPVRTVRVKVTDLISESDKKVKISRNHINIYKVCYVYAYQTCGVDFPSGLWPDPLVKFEAFDIAEYDYQPIWITVDVPREAKAGIYRGRVTVTSVRDVEIEIPIELRVRTFSLPITPALKTSFSVWPKLIARQIGIDRKSLKIEKLVYEDYWREALKHRITLRNIPTYGPKFNRFVSEILKKGATTIALRMWPLLTCKPENKKAIQHQLIKNGWIDKSFVYIWDEPSEKDYPKIIERAKKIKPYAPKIKLLCTTRYDKSLDPYIDIWVPRFSWFNKNPELYRKAVQRGDELWLYTCAYPQRPYPNLFLELPGIEPRICVLMCWRYGVSGFLYYSINYWKSKDIWRNVRGYPEANLDGVLVYPSRDGRPVISMRLEILRDGIDDYDYLTILKGLSKGLSESGVDEKGRGLALRAEELTDIRDMIKSFTDWTKDVKKVESRREQVAELIEAIRSYRR